LSRGEAGRFLTEPYSGCGPGFNKAAHEAPTFKVTAEGVALDWAFLEMIRCDSSKGVLIVEGVATSDAPLVVEVLCDGSLVWTKELPMSISGIEDMYRWHNFRPNPQFLERLGSPSNRPDDECIKNMDVFIAHGVNVPEDEGRAWGAEFFKRLYREGMNARFHAVTWKSDSGGDDSYELNVNNAFLTASNYAVRVNGIKAEKGSTVVVLAHSLGTILTGAAIADGQMQADKFFALNGSAPAEAFAPDMVNEATNATNPLLHSDWRGYDSKTWASCWYNLFTNSVAFPNDDRAKLT
jgi:hypothetical protein